MQIYPRNNKWEQEFRKTHFQFFIFASSPVWKLQVWSSTQSQTHKTTTQGLWARRSDGTASETRQEIKRKEAQRRLSLQTPTLASTLALSSSAGSPLSLKPIGRWAAPQGQAPWWLYSSVLLMLCWLCAHSERAVCPRMGHFLISPGCLSHGQPARGTHAFDHNGKPQTLMKGEKKNRGVLSDENSIIFFFSFFCKGKRTFSGMRHNEK